MYGASYPPAPTRSSRSTSSSTTSASNGSQGTSMALGQQQRVSAPAPDDVPGSVRNLLLSSKQLPSVLAHWAAGSASETDVSDVYVQMGTDFNAAVQAFAYHRIDLSDIHSVPGELRTVLEGCLAEDPSPEVLAAFLPDLRAVLVKLLRGLQARQEAWRRARAGTAGAGANGYRDEYR